MKRYTGRSNGAENLNSERLNRAYDIINSLEDKYGCVDNSMMAAVIASMNQIDNIVIKGCQGLKKEKGLITSVRVLGKDGKKLSVIAADENGNYKSGTVSQSKVYQVMGIESSSNEITEEDFSKEDR